MSYTASAIWVFMTLTFWGLVLIFLGVLDIKLLAEHVKTISERVWAGNNLLGIAIVGWVLAAAVFLAGHFWLG